MLSSEKKPTMRLLTVENVTKSYGSHCAVSDASFSIQSGELVALLGENGAGKTTLLQMMAGLLTPDQGTIKVAEARMAPRATSVKQVIGYLAEQPFLYPTLSGFEFLEFVGALYRLSRSLCAERAWELLGDMHLHDVAHQRIQSYSQGMRRRLALCAMLMHRPRLLLLDEPLNGLDPTHVYDVKLLLSQLCAEGCAVLISTHLLDVAERLCSRAIILSHGHILADGPLDDLRRMACQPEQSTLEAIFIALTSAQNEQNERHDIEEKK